MIMHGFALFFNFSYMHIIIGSIFPLSSDLTSGT